MNKPMNNYAAKIDKLRNDRGWSVYRLAQESDIPEQSINKWLYQGAMITLPLLEKICDAFGITVAEFFTEGKMVELTPDRQSLFDTWISLNKEQRAAVDKIISTYKK